MVGNLTCAIITFRIFLNFDSNSLFKFVSANRKQIRIWSLWTAASKVILIMFNAKNSPNLIPRIGWFFIYLMLNRYTQALGLILPFLPKYCCKPPKRILDFHFRPEPIDFYPSGPVSSPDLKSRLIHLELITVRDSAQDSVVSRLILNGLLDV